MGQTYNVTMRLKFSNKRAAKIALMGRLCSAVPEHVNYNLKHFEEIGIGIDKLEHLLKIFFGGWEGKLRRKALPNGQMEYSSDFDASYGWEVVMMEAFEAMASFLEDDSEIKIYPDSGVVDYGFIRDEEVIWS